MVDDVSLAVVHDAVEADAFGDDRCRDILVIHLASLSLELGVGLAACLVDVVLYDGLLVEAVVALEDCLRHLGGVGLEGEEFREVTLDEELELILVEELHVVLHDLREELVVALVSLELSLAVELACDEHRVESCTVFEDEQIRVKTELPPVVNHRLRDGHKELQIDLSPTFCEVLKARCYGGCVKNFSCHHFSCLLVLDCLHEEGIVSICIFDDDGILNEFLRLDLGWHC